MQAMAVKISRRCSRESLSMSEGTGSVRGGTMIAKRHHGTPDLLATQALCSIAWIRRSSVSRVKGLVSTRMPVSRWASSMTWLSA